MVTGCKWAAPRAAQPGGDPARTAQGLSDRADRQPDQSEGDPRNARKRWRESATRAWQYVAGSGTQPANGNRRARHIGAGAWPADLPRDVVIFVGNVASCTQGVRFVGREIDFNRAWPGSELDSSPTHELLACVTREVLALNPIASVDIHNNTGRNPHYGCICSMEPQHLALASMFSDKAIYFTRPKGVQTQAFMDHCPSVTIECPATMEFSPIFAPSMIVAPIPIKHRSPISQP